MKKTDFRTYCPLRVHWSGVWAVLVWLPGLFAVPSALAQRSFTACGQPVVENFDGLTAGAQNGPVFYSTRGLGNIEVNPPTLPPNDGGAFRYRCRSNQSDWALGARPSDATGEIRYGVRFVNNTGRPITTLDVRYFLEQYSLAQNGSQINTNFFAYKINETNLMAAGFTDVPALNCTAIHSSTQAGGNQLAAYCGNDPANRTQISGQITDICLAPGETILFRWTDPNNDSNDPHLGIDDLVVTPNCELPNLTLTPPGPVVFCQGDPAQTLVAEGAARYEWQPPTDLSRTDIASPSLTPNTPGTRTYTVTGFNGNCPTQATLEVTVHPKPRAVANANPLAPCPGATVQLSGSGGQQYSWSTTGGTLSNPNIANPTLTIPPAASGSSIQLTLTVTDANGCTDFVDLDLNVLNQPNVQVDPLDRACAAQRYTLRARGALTYLWAPAADLLDPASASPDFTPSATGAQTFTVTGTDANGCTNTASLTVTVVNAPPLTARALPATSVCLNGPLSLDAQPANLVTYRWLPATDLSADDVPNPTVNTAQPLSRTYTVTGTDANGCTNTAEVSVEVGNVGFDLTINPPGPLTLCVDGPPVQLTASGTGAVRFQWSPATDLSADNIPNPILSPRTPTGAGVSRIYSLVATDANGCESQAELEVQVGERPTLAALADPASLCAGQSTTLTATGAQTYTWEPGGSTGSPLTVSPGQTTTYTVTGTDASGCTNTADVTVTVSNAITLTAAADPASLCAGQTTTLTATGGQTYTWEPGGLSGSPQPVSPTQTTTYTVTGSDANGCTATATVEVLVIEGMTFDPNAPHMACAGSTVSLPLRNMPAGATPTLSSTPANGIVLRLVGSAVEVQANVPGLYRISASAPAGGCPNLAELELIIREAPVVLASTDGGITELCVGQPLLLSASGADRYDWSPMTDLSNATLSGDAILFTPRQAGVVTIRVQGALDDPNFPGLPCSAEATLTLTVRPAPDFSALVRLVETCVDQPVRLGEGLADSPGALYRWSPALQLNDAQSRQPEFRSSDAGTFPYTVSATLAACSASATVTVTVHPQPVVTISPAQPDDIKVGTALTLTASGADTYTWEPTANLIGPADRDHITLAHDQEGTFRYTVTGTETRFGCTNTASVSIVVMPVRSMNVITPNGDNINEVFYYDADPAVYRSIATRVFDRYGVRMFEGNAFGEANGWRGTDRNGKEAPAGAYHFVVELERFDGKRLTRTGTVTLLR